MGFNSGGVERGARAASRAATATVVGVNVGKNKDTPEDGAVDDFARADARARAARRLRRGERLARRTRPGCATCRRSSALRPILAAVPGGGADRPVLVKIAPDLSDEDVDAVADLALELGLAGIIATNTTIVARRPARRRPPRSRRSARAACRARRCARGRSRCCAGCARGPGTGWSSWRPAGSPTPTTPGSGSSAGRDARRALHGLRLRRSGDRRAARDAASRRSARARGYARVQEAVGSRSRDARQKTLQMRRPASISLHRSGPQLEVERIFGDVGLQTPCGWV